jgi:hypothetical protein
MIGLLTTTGGYAVDALVSAGELPFAAVDVSFLKLSHYTCPYRMPMIERGNTVVVVSGWLRRLQQQALSAPRVLDALRERFQRIIGLDHADPFQLDFTDEIMDAMDVVLKVNGVYRDPDLYNYAVGAPTPDGRWTEKVEPRAVRYKPRNLEKIRVSVPCFLGVATEVRRRVRRHYCDSVAVRTIRSVGDRVLECLPRPLDSTRPPRYTAHFYGSLTHVQRIEAIRKLKASSIPWRGGITAVPPFISGLRGVGIARLDAAEQRELTAALASEGVLVSRRGRLGYQLTMRDCKAVVSIAGYGELCFRIAEAWANRRILVCQSVAHAEMLFPLVSGWNAVFCRPDLRDLTYILDDIECNFGKYIDVAERGHQEWVERSTNFQQVIREGFAPLYL